MTLKKHWTSHILFVCLEIDKDVTLSINIWSWCSCYSPCFGNICKHWFVYVIIWYNLASWLTKCFSLYHISKYLTPVATVNLSLSRLDKILKRLWGFVGDELFYIIQTLPDRRNIENVSLLCHHFYDNFLMKNIPLFYQF